MSSLGSPELCCDWESFGDRNCDAIHAKMGCGASQKPKQRDPFLFEPEMRFEPLKPFQRVERRQAKSAGWKRYQKSISETQ